MKKLIFLVFACFIIAVTTSAQEINDVKSATAFIYNMADSGYHPNGTGFFVGINSLKHSTKYFYYLVTAKHVVQEKERSFYKTIYFRVDNKRQNSKFFPINITPGGDDKNVYFSTDPTVDLAVFPVSLPWDTLNIVPLRPSYLSDTTDFDRLSIEEGTDVFFIGLFNWDGGYDKIEPMVRFGKIAMIPKERVMSTGEKRWLILLDCDSYGGNSGAPAYFKLPTGDGKTTHVLLAGVVKGSFAATVDQKITPNIKRSNINTDGISEITPSYQLKAILYGKELSELRKKNDN